MKIGQIAAAVEKIAPLKLAQDWDNVGLLVGDDEKNINNVLVTIDVTKSVVAEAKKLGVDMILSYHPVIWDGLKTVTAKGEGEIVHELIKSGICVYSIHTAYDVAAGGVNDALAEVVGIADGEPIGDYVESPAGKFYKLIVFIPKDDVNKVADALYGAGAGAIGNYSHCGFQTDGLGTFLPLDEAKPAIGRKNKLEKIGEIKLETIVSADRIEDAVAAMRKVHPYETPAFDVIRHYDVERKFGLGRIGKLAKATDIKDIIARIKKATGANAVGFIGRENRKVRTAAVCAGSCGKIINSVISKKCDLYLTGELKHHHALLAQEADVSCICLSHTVSERFALKNLVKDLKKELKNVTIQLSKKDNDPFRWKQI